MRKNIVLRYISLLAITSLIFFGCKKDPYKGVVSNERSIEAVTLGNGLVQVGPAIVDRVSGTVSVKVLMQAGTDLSKVAPLVQPSYKATVSPASGETVNFAASNNVADYTVTSESGQTRKWTIELVPFTETILGTYTIQGLVLYGGTGPEYGGGAVMNLTDKPWVWPADDGPSFELDNKLTFEFTGVTPDGKTYGTVTNDAGADGKYANFIFIRNATTEIDVNHFYRKIPKGESKWERDYTANTIKFTFPDGSTTLGTFKGAETLDLGNGKSKTITDNSFDFTLNGADDWGNIYSDFDKFVQRPRRFWIDVKK